MSALTGTPTALNNLLHDIGKDLDLEHVRYLKYLLQGHVNKETLQDLESGIELTEVLKKRGLVSEKRLAFLRKLLVEAKCLKLVNLVDGFKEKFAPGVSFGDRDDQEGNAKRNTKRETILRMIERLENEIAANEECEAELNNEVKKYEMQIQANNEKLVNEEEEIQKIKEKIKENEASIESFERKLETVRFFLRKQDVELDKIKQKLEKNKNSASVKMELKEKMVELEKGKKDEDELISKHQKALDDIRSIHVEIRHRTEEIIRLEDTIHDTFLQIRIIKHNVHKNQRMRMELQEKLDITSIDLEETNRHKPITPALSSRAHSRFKSYSRTEARDIDQAVDYKILDYSEVTMQESTVIGRKGKGTSPPQFNLPVGVAVNSSGQIHVADYGNGRIHVISTDGKVQKQPLTIGGKCRPCALATSCRGDLAMTDSQIIRVFNKNGEFLRPILPVYSKNDRRPELCSIAFDTSCCIYAGDKANHRIQKFNFEGNFLYFIGSPEEINYPIGIAVTKHGDVIVSDYLKHHLRVFFRVRALEAKTIGAKGIGVCKFAYPRGITLDQQENILVADSQNHRIQVVTMDGECVGSFGSVGDDPGSFNTPYDVAVDRNGNIIVADTKNHRVQVFTRLVPVYSSFDNNENGDINENSDEKHNGNENTNGNSEERENEGIKGVENDEEKLNDDEDLKKNSEELEGEENHGENIVENTGISNPGNSELKNSSTDEESTQETNQDNVENGGVSERDDIGDDKNELKTIQETPSNEETTEQNSNKNSSGIGNSENGEEIKDKVVAQNVMNEKKTENVTVEVTHEENVAKIIENKISE